MPARCPTCKKSNQLTTLKALFADKALLSRLPEERQRQLSLPPIPDPVNPRPMTIVMGIVLVITFLLGLIALGISYRRLGAGSGAVNGFCLSAFLLLGPLFYWPQLRDRLQARALENEQELLRWEKLRERWCQLLYCLRDDIVFDPSDGTILSPETLIDVLQQDLQAD